MKNGFCNWQDVRVFLAVMREGSTLAASRKLGMSQPTVARRIDVLEHETGLTLFARGTRGFRLTPAGEALVPQAEAIEAAAIGFGAQAAKLLREHSAPIRITAGAANFSPRFASILSDFSDLHPAVQFELVPSYGVLDLRAGEADIALRIAKDIGDPELVCRKISEAQFTLYASPRYIERHGKPASLDDLADHKFVTFLSENVSSRLHDWLAARVQPGQIVSSTRSVDAQITAIQSGLGIGVMNVGLASGRENMVPCFDPPGELTAPHWLLVSPEAWVRPEVKAFVKFFAPRYSALFRR